MSKRTWTDEQLINAIPTSTSIRQVLIKLNLKPAGGNYKSINNKITELKVDTSHFLGKGYLKGRPGISYRKIPLKDILVKNSTYTNTSRLKKRLLAEGMFTHKCYRCNKTKWLNQLIPVELEHINGINNDHRLKNLILLCPNCHALTSTYRGKNIKKKERKQIVCKQCASKITAQSKSGLCVPCATKVRVYKRIPTTDNEKLKIIKEAKEKGIRPTGRKYDVSPTTIRRWINTQ